MGTLMYRWGVMTTTVTSKRNWQRPKQALRIAGVSESTLYRWTATGVVKTMKIGGVRYIDVSRWETKPEGPDA